MKLADTSAWSWSRRVGGDLARGFREAGVAGEIATCAMVKLELLKSVRSSEEFEQAIDRFDALPDCRMVPGVWDRALEVYGLLAVAGGMHQRSVKHPDLLIAAAAELAGVPILHYDEDYDRIAAVTGQPTEWLAPRGSLGDDD